jgi:putative FmdB family regulatory protein
MPLYDYRCSNCGAVIEVRHGFDEAHAQACPSCGGALSRVFNPAPILFKGSGFYVTDSRSKPSDSSTSSGDAKPASSGGESAA